VQHIGFHGDTAKLSLQGGSINNRTAPNQAETGPSEIPPHAHAQDCIEVTYIYIYVSMYTLFFLVCTYIPLVSTSVRTTAECLNMLKLRTPPRLWPEAASFSAELRPLRATAASVHMPFLGARLAPSAPETPPSLQRNPLCPKRFVRVFKGSWEPVKWKVTAVLTL